jgi:hypothetical protein
MKAKKSIQLRKGGFVQKCLVIGIIILFNGIIYVSPSTADVTDNDLIFIHHSVGKRWLDHSLHNALVAKNYIDERNDIYYGTDLDPDSARPDSLAPTPGDKTNMNHWILWFNDYLNGVKKHGCDDGFNKIIMFKSCYPISNIVANGSEPGDPFSSTQTVVNYTAVYRHPSGSGNTYIHNGYTYEPLEDVFADNPDILFIPVTAPPRHYAPVDATTDAEAHRARVFNNWLKDDWLDDYNSDNPGLNNVAVFDFFDVLAYPDDHSSHPNRLKKEYGGESGDSHPKPEGNDNATKVFATNADNFIDTAWNAFGNNNPPNAPKDPSPPDGATNIDINADLSWNCTDPDGDDLTYDVYFEANDSTPDVLVSNNQSESTYDPGTMNYNTQYYWKIVAWDGTNQSTEGPVWDFTTTSIPNNPPYIPSDPDPENGSIDVLIDSDLSWTGGDPDPDDTVVYDVYLEADDPTPDNKVADDISETTFDPGTLDFGTTYYWRIIAQDNHGASIWGPVWHFTTESKADPDLACSGNLRWTDITPKEKVTGSFSVINIGEPGSELDWMVIQFPDWGTWTITPSSGYDLTPEEGPFTVNVSVIAPNKVNTKFSGSVKIGNKENRSDNCTISVSLQTPRNKPFIYLPQLLELLFERFFQRFPMMIHFLRALFFS